LLTQRKLAAYARERGAHYVFTVKGNQPGLQEAIHLLFENRGAPDYQEEPVISHGRFEQRAIWTSDQLNDYLDFPGIGQVFAIERQRINKKTGKGRDKTEIVYGITSHTATSAAAILADNRGHWTVENSCHYVLGLELGRGPLHRAHGPWPRKSHRPAPVCHRPDPGQEPRYRFFHFAALGPLSQDGSRLPPTSCQCTPAARLHYGLTREKQICPA
jgi:hypothetical protein